VWNHFDTNGCPGQAVGVRTRLDNGVTGFIHVRNLSDKHITNPEERVQVKLSFRQEFCWVGLFVVVAYGSPVIENY
jgi:S1 RNA binding domain